jgi:hypothetical protein
MSAALLGLAFAAKVGTPVAKLILLKLVDCCDDEGRKIFPSLGTLADAAGCSPRHARRVLRDFQVVGLLRRVRDGGFGKGSTAHYEMDIDLLTRLRKPEAWPALSVSMDVAEDDGGSISDAPEADQSHDEDAYLDTGDAKESRILRRTPCPPKSADRRSLATAQADSRSPPTPQENPLNQRERGAGANAQAGASPGRPGHDDSEGHAETEGLAESPIPTFETFRKAWPSGAVDNQSLMLGAWSELTSPQKCAAIAGIPDFLDELKRHGRSHRPSGVTYLRQRSWLLIERRRANGDAPQFVTAKPWSRLWWARLHLAIAGKLRRESGVLVKPSLLIQLAGNGTGDMMRKHEEVEARPELLRAFPASSDEARAFVTAVARRGVHFPLFGPEQWIWLPQVGADQSGLQSGDL